MANRNSNLSRRKIEKVLEYYFLHRVVYVPLNKPNLFALMFGHGDTVKMDVDLIVLWDDKNKSFEYFPSKSFPAWPNMNKDYDIAYPIYDELIPIDFLNNYSERDPSVPIHKAQTNWFVANYVQQCINEGYWTKTAATNRNRGLKKEALKDPLLKRLLAGRQTITCVAFIVRSGAHCMFVKDIATQKFITELNPCPYRVVRRFLKHVGIEPERRSPTSGRRILSKIDKIDILNYLKEFSPNGIPTKEIVLQAFEDSSLPAPTPHLLQKYRSIRF